MKSFVGYIIDKAVKAIPKKKKVSPDIKSVKPTKLPVSESIKKTKGDEYRKRYTALDKAEGKLKTGKQMMKEGQKERKKLVDTGRAFKFPNLKSFHAVQPGKPNKLAKKPTPDKKFKKGKELREKKMGGGMMGRRMGYSQGKLVGNQKKIDVAAPFGTINAKDFKKLREGKRMQAKDGTGPEQFMRSGVKEDPMRDRMKQPLKLKRSKALMLEDLKKSKFKKRKP